MDNILKENNMIKISEETKGGDVYTEDQGLFGGFSLPCHYGKKGDTSPKIKKTKYKCDLVVPYELEVTETLEPLKRNGEPVGDSNKKPSFHVEIKFPVSSAGIAGTIDMHVGTYGITAEQIAEKILEAIGNNLLSMKLRKEN